MSALSPTHSRLSSKLFSIKAAVEHIEGATVRLPQVKSWPPFRAQTRTRRGLYRRKHPVPPKCFPRIRVKVPHALLNVSDACHGLLKRYNLGVPQTSAAGAAGVLLYCSHSSHVGDFENSKNIPNLSTQVGNNRYWATMIIATAATADSTASKVASPKFNSLSCLIWL